VDEAIATEVVELLRTRRIFASLNRRAGVYNVGVRVVIPDGREAIWDNDGAAGLEAMVLRDGVLVGFVPQIPDSDDLDAAAVAGIIAATDYDAPVAAPTAPVPTAAPGSSTSEGAPPEGAPPNSGPASAAPARAGWRDRLRRGR
jgi:hypothetical protein